MPFFKQIQQFTSAVFHAFPDDIDREMNLSTLILLHFIRYGIFYNCTKVP